MAQFNLTREQIITSMCYTHDHGYGLEPEEVQTAMWNQMAQIFDNDIAPYMEFNKEVRKELRRLRREERRAIRQQTGYSRVGYGAMTRGK